jgi:serine/threonine protein kinase
MSSLDPTVKIRGSLPAERPGPADPTRHLADAGFVLESRLGQGGMGEVWRARDRTGQTVALKVLLHAHEHSSEHLARFQREAAVLASLSHPNIVKLYEYGTVARTPYFTMKLIDGPSLRQYSNQRALTVGDSLRLISSIARAVDYAHRCGVVHRDLKPSNIMLDGGQPTVVDFGIALRHGESLTAQGSVMGTLDYMSPEQTRDSHDVDGRSDTYALGLMLYELLCCELPRGLFKLPSERVAEVPRAVDDALRRALAADPRERFETAGELSDALDAAQTGPPTPAQRPATEQTTRVTLEQDRVQVVLAGALNGTTVAPAAGALSTMLGRGGRRDIVYELGAAIDVPPAAMKPLARVHAMHRERIRRIAVCAPQPMLRGSALVLTAAVPEIAARVFATQLGATKWLAEAAS